VLALGLLVVGSPAHTYEGLAMLVIPEVNRHVDEYALEIGVTYEAAIEGVSGAPETIPVWVKSSVGNTMHTATRLEGCFEYPFQHVPGCVRYSFTYTPPTRSTGGEFDACGTATVFYDGYDGTYQAGMPCGGGQPSWLCWACGGGPVVIRFVNASGAGIPCSPTSVENAPWSTIKSLFR
jgi:hypothetical protein